MSFSSITFIWVFLPITVACYYLLTILPKITCNIKNVFLLLVSLFFYAWGSIRSVPFLLGCIMITWIGGLSIERLQSISRKTMLALLIVLEIEILFSYKYWNFFADNLQVIRQIALPHLDGFAPIGISFIIFQSIAYLVDVYRRDSKACASLISLGLYMAFFPQVVVGPIVRYNFVEETLNHRTITPERITHGAKRFIIGLGKKVIIADCLGQTVDTILAFDSSMWGSSFAWLVFIGYSMQLYYDFSGYTDMALGLGYAFGFDLPENFNLPYTATSIKDFWQRWHITLSNWFRNYVYIPLGGNRKGQFRTYINLSIIWILTGLWHGASWNFVFWGMWHGVFSLLERYRLGDLLKNCKIKTINHVYTIIVSFIGWMFFRITDLTQAVHLLKLLVIPTPIDARLTTYYFINPYVLTVLAFAVFLCGPAQWLLKKAKNKINPTIVSVVKWILLAVILVYSLSQVVSSTYSAFIYQQF